MNGTDLLADFRDNRSESAFGELVRRYTNLVYSVAWRRLSNAALAQEVTQLVFIRLARSAPSLPGDGELAGWLHRTTVRVSIDLWRTETRRRLREEQAMAMQSHPSAETSWNHVAPVLDEALDALSDSDRQTLLLRFFEQKPMRELGDLFGISEDAAKMRVSRALDRLRGQLGARHVTCSAVALGAFMADRSVEAAPGPVVVALASLSLPMAVGGGATSVLSTLVHVVRMKWVFVPVLVVCGVVTALWLRDPQRSRQTAVAIPAESSTNPITGQPVAATNGGMQATNEAAGANEPDPLKLLQAVAQARSRIGSGSMELDVTTVHMQRGKRRETNQLQLAGEFEGAKLHWEQVGREYRYTALGDASAAQQARIEAEGLDKAAAVREGLLQGFEARDVRVYDGATLFTYREIDGKSGDTTIDDPSRGGSYIFDPRCLGLGVHLSAGTTVKDYLAYEGAKSIELKLRESVDSIPAWRIAVKSRHDRLLEFWLDVAQPTRVLKFSEGTGVVVSKYDPLTTSHPIPIEVATVYIHPSYEQKQRFVRKSAWFNAPIAPATFTLAGLGMAVGSSVSDNRIHRRIGYWTGAGLSEHLPRKGAEALPAPELGELLATLQREPKAPAALEAALWILLNTPDGPAVEQAAGVILQEHLASTNLTQLSRELERMRHRCATNLLVGILENNPSVETRATACFSLGSLFKEAARHGSDRVATAAAAAYFERVITEFGRHVPTGAALARRAKPELHELRHVLIGQPAPEMEGEDLDGRRMSLRDYRGNVVVLAFWSGSGSDAAGLRTLAERMSGKPFAILGVNCDKDLDRAKASVATNEISWPSFRDGRDGPISAAWNVNSWLTVIVLDPQGIIRYRGYCGKEFYDAIQALLGE